ncbi:MAG: NADP-dependent malic enzyme [Geminicoccaceae bacterium]|nr:NADP-dependent malic enzyme [Geminicoccaceae bacterium]MCS7268731.1 NADP-dependent malic enzyme [Geminicoccaceae bacterium]MCX7629097.1 NADP-dependent malic enzyme [Geminicoccaceae bacterium]MDW8125807.1 NADP-dependent malic enzyme [Geminicoccaceae bacterium]MDW8342603.1 NADP-dependent malic enzyme [Geminicoccaceae bacterium]
MSAWDEGTPAAGGPVTAEEALALHAKGRPGKLEITPTKPLATQRDLSLAYSPGVAAPCLAIAREPDRAYDYTAKGNLVAVISNGTAVLGLGNLGPLASKPVMEGKAVLFKRFADIDAVDLEIATEDVDAFVDCVRLLAPTFGGINLEDIKAPECFVIEQRLRELVDIPVFHDDQHGTAIIAAAGLINALDLTGRSLRDVKIVINGAGAAGIACAELIKAMGVPHDHVILCDTQGVVYRGRERGMNQWKSAHAVDTDARTLADAMRGADVAFGLSVRGAFTPEMIASMAKNPIVFAMANPDPEITPELAREVRKDVIIATGRSDYPNQINNVLGFPYIFRGALDVRASTINEAMKIAAAYAIAALAREDVPDEVTAAYRGRRLRYGPDYLIPTPFDPRLITHVPSAVAQAAIESGVARRPIVDVHRYRAELRSRLDPTASRMQLVIDRVRAQPKRVVFAEGEEEKAIRAAMAWRNEGLGTPILIGREERIAQTLQNMGLKSLEGVEIHNARLSEHNRAYAEFLYRRQQRNGLLFRDCQRLVNQDRNVFAACMVANGHADAMITGLTRNYHDCLNDVLRVIDPRPGHRIFGLTILVARGRTVFIADTSVHELPDTNTLADIAIQTARAVRRMGVTPRVALLSFATFGNPPVSKAARIREVVLELDRRQVDFEYDGEMGADVALDPDLLALYPFCRLKAPANVLIMPALHSANISYKLLKQLGGGTVIGPLLEGLAHPVQIVPMNATVSDILNLAAIAAHDAIREPELVLARAAAE